MNVRRAVRTAAACLALSGVAVAGYGLYRHFDPFAQARQHASAERLDRSWHSPVPHPVRVGDPFVYLRIPRLGGAWRFTVTEGVTPDVLNAGPGHFPATAGPGEVGNFAVAGHTIGGGDPFKHLSTLKQGDPIYVDGRYQTFTYRVTTAPHVIPVTDMGILAPVPDRPGVTADTAQLTIVSCLWPNPNDGQRQAVTAALDQNGAHP